MRRFNSIHHVDAATIALMYQEYAPIFVLTTGRSGSRFLVHLLHAVPGVKALHEPQPTLQYFSDFAFRNHRRLDVLKAIVDTARMELVLETAIRGLIYVEANQCLTFFAPAMAEVFRGARFVHLVRHPGDFVRSAIRKGWHRNDSIWESGRLRLADPRAWRAMDQMEKLGWLWTTTNRFIRSFLSEIEASRGLVVTTESLTRELAEVGRLLEFIGCGEIAPATLAARHQKRVNELTIGPDEPPNMRKVSEYPSYVEWPVEARARLRALCGEEADHYDYAL